MKNRLNPPSEDILNHDRMTCPVCVQEREQAGKRVRVKRAIRRLLIARGIPVPDAHIMDWLIQYVEDGK